MFGLILGLCDLGNARAFLEMHGASTSIKDLWLNQVGHLLLKEESVSDVIACVDSRCCQLPARAADIAPGSSIAQCAGQDPIARHAG